MTTSPRSEIPPSDLVRVTIRTLLGACYEFPDMDRKEIDKLFKDDVARFGNLTLVNISEAVLVVPLRIISVLLVNDEEKWRGFGTAE